MPQPWSTLAPPTGQSEAAAAIWDWSAERPAKPDAGGWRNPRLRGAVQGGIALGAGALLWVFWSHVGGGIVLGIGGLMLLASQISPTGLYLGIERGLQSLGHALSRAVSWLLLASVFYLFFLPFGKLFRRGSRDAMRRFYEPEATTYWEPRTRGRSASTSRARQY